MTGSLILKRGSASRLQRRDDDYDVLENGVIVGRIFRSPGARRGVNDQGGPFEKADPLRT